VHYYRALYNFVHCIGASSCWNWDRDGVLAVLLLPASDTSCVRRPAVCLPGHELSRQGVTLSRQPGSHAVISAGTIGRRRRHRGCRPDGIGNVYIDDEA